MASFEYLHEEMKAARARADNKALPANVRHAAESMFWHCLRRVGTMERGGTTHDEPGHYMVQHSELAHVARKSAAASTPAIPSLAEHKRALLDARTEAHFKAKETL